MGPYLKRNVLCQSLTLILTCGSLPQTNIKSQSLTLMLTSDIIPIVKDVSTPARVIEVAEVTGVDVSARQATNAETEEMEMTDVEAGTEEVVIDGEKERSGESKEGGSESDVEKDTNLRAEDQESEDSEEQGDGELREMGRQLAKARSPVVEIQRPQVEGRDLEDIIRIRVEKEVKRRMAEKEPPRVEGNSEILGQAVKAVGDCLLMQTEARFTREALTSIKSQSVTSSMNIGRLNAKTSHLGESVERVEQKCDNIAAKVNNLQSTRDVSQVMMTAAKRTKRTEKAAERMEVAVNGFKEGLFTMIQSLIDSQQALSTQMTVQACSFGELTKAINTTFAKHSIKEQEQEAQREEEKGKIEESENIEENNIMVSSEPLSSVYGMDEFDREWNAAQREQDWKKQEKREQQEKEKERLRKQEEQRKAEREQCEKEERIRRQEEQRKAERERREKEERIRRQEEERKSERERHEKEERIKRQEEERKAERERREKEETIRKQEEQKRAERRQHEKKEESNKRKQEEQQKLEKEGSELEEVNRKEEGKKILHEKDKTGNYTLEGEGENVQPEKEKQSATKEGVRKRSRPCKENEDRINQEKRGKQCFAPNKGRHRSRREKELEERRRRRIYRHQRQEEKRRRMERLRKERRAKYMNSWEKEAKRLKKEEDHQKEAKRLKKENDRKQAEEDRKRIIAEGKEKSSSKSRPQGTPLREIHI